MKSNRYYKTIAILISLALNATGFAGVGEAIGYYLDTEGTENNAFLASSLDMTLATTSWSIAPQ